MGLEDPKWSYMLSTCILSRLGEALKEVLETIQGDARNAEKQISDTCCSNSWNFHVFRICCFLYPTSLKQILFFRTNELSTIVEVENYPPGPLGLFGLLFFDWESLAISGGFRLVNMLLIFTDEEWIHSSNRRQFDRPLRRLSTKLPIQSHPKFLQCIFFPCFCCVFWKRQHLSPSASSVIIRTVPWINCYISLLVPTVHLPMDGKIHL